MDAASPNLCQKDTSTLAGEVAARASTSRRQSILELIGRHPPGLAIFEIAKLLGCHDHQISGRFSELLLDGLIVKTGQRRLKPNTKCEAEVYGLPGPSRPLHPDAAQQLGYPDTLKIGDEGIFTRAPILGDKDLPGIPYSLHGLAWRVEILECPGCGRQLKLIEKGKYQCGTASCHRTWFPMLVSECGKTPVLALVMKYL